MVRSIGKVRAQSRKGNKQEDIMTQYEAIFQRTSVRHFQMRAIEPKIMEQINSFIQSVSPLHPEALYRVAVVEAGKSADGKKRKHLQVEAPYYLVISVKDHPFAEKNAGFVMEQIVLYLTSKGLGTCYLDAAGTQKTMDSYRPLLLVAFGCPAVSGAPVHRRRKPLSELARYKEEVPAGVAQILEAGRVAPSAFNRQPWRFVVYANRIHIFMKKPVISTAHGRQLEEIGMGIVMTHMALAAEEQWMNWKLSPIGDVAERELKGYAYAATLQLSSQEFPQS